MKQRVYRSEKNGNDNVLPKKVGIIYSDVKKEFFSTEAQFITEKDADEDAILIGNYLKALDINVSLYAGNELLPFHLNLDRPEMVINLVDSVKGNESLAYTIPGILGLLNIPFTGADILGLSLDTNKCLIKKQLRLNGISVPNFQLINSPKEEIDPTLRFPLITKLNAVHGAVEITSDAVSENMKHLRDRLHFLIQTYHQPVLIEEFIIGPEITAIVMDGTNRNVCMAKKVFLHSNGKYIYTTFEDQWMLRGDAVFRYEKFIEDHLKEIISQAFDITRMRDYGKFDIRLDSAGQYFFIDTNCNPAFGPKEMDVALSVILDMYGISFIDILKRLLLNTMRNATRNVRLPLPTSSEV